MIVAKKHKYTLCIDVNTFITAEASILYFVLCTAEREKKWPEDLDDCPSTVTA